MTDCHSLVKHDQNALEIGTWAIMGSSKSNMSSSLNIDMVLISYAYTMT